MISKIVRYVMFFVATTGLFVFFLALYLLSNLNYSEKWIAYVFLVIGAIIFIAACYSIFKINRRLKNYALTQEKLKDLYHQSGSASDSVWDIWEFNSNDWQKFLKNELKRKRIDLLITGILIVILGTPLLIFARAASFGAAIGVSAALALIYAFVSYYYNKSRYTSKISDKVKVVFFKDYLLINDKLVVLNDDKITLFEVNLKQTEKNSTIEFRIFWITSKGKRAEDEIYIPLITDKMNQASLLVEKYKAGLNC